MPPLAACPGSDGSPQRINYPLKRIGERGSGQWKRISWEQALDEIAGKLETLKQQFGPEMLATSIGGPHTTFWPLHRFMTLFGSPNNMGNWSDLLEPWYFGQCFDVRLAA
jgi:anaerobic selenocysteine-containing dehydrogenase